MTRENLYRLTLSEFLNAWKGYTDEKQLDYQAQMEAARLVLSGLVKKPPKFPWEKAETQAYTEAEKQAIVAAHENKKIVKKQIITNEGWKDVCS